MDVVVWVVVIVNFIIIAQYCQTLQTNLNCNSASRLIPTLIDHDRQPTIMMIMTMGKREDDGGNGDDLIMIMKMTKVRIMMMTLMVEKVMMMFVIV